MKLYNKYFLYLFGLVLVGCGKKKPFKVSTKIEQTQKAGDEIEKIDDEVFVQKSVEDAEDSFKESSKCNSDDKKRLKFEPQRIFFGFDRHDINKKDISKLVKLAETIKKIIKESKDFVVVYIYGNCDKRGATSYNVGLSIKRANAIKEILIECGIPSNRIKTTGLGQIILVEGDSEDAYAQNRVAIFSFEEKSFEKFENKSSSKKTCQKQVENEDDDEDDEEN